MKKINFKIIFLFSIILCLFLIGCQSKISFVVINFELKEDVYVGEFSNIDKEIDITEYIKCENQKAIIKYFYDVDRNNEITDYVLPLEEGNNLVYCTIECGKTKEDIVLNFYRLKLYKVSFVTNCSTKIDDQFVEENGFAIEPEKEMKNPGYAFNGWNRKFNKPITNDTIFEAKWIANSYLVTYDTDGGEIEFSNTIVTYGEPFELDIPTKEGYIFLGWKYNGRIITGDKWSIDKDIVVTAAWDLETKTFEIEYVIVGAVGPNLQRTYTNKENVVLRTPYKNGYRFVGWYYEGDFSGERVYEIPAGTEGNLRLYSKWKKFTLAGSKISFLGDSITTFYSENSDVNSLYNKENSYYYPIYSPTVKSVEQTWWYQVVSQTNTKLVVNESYSGSSCYNNGSTTNNAAMNMNRIQNLEGSDIVVVLIGTNDNVNGHSVEKFTNAYDKMLKNIKKTCPDAYVFCCTLGYSGYTDYYYTEERRILFNDVIRTIAENNDAAIIEIAEVQTKETYADLLGDRLHPNANGMIAYANKAIEIIKNYVGA